MSTVQLDEEAVFQVARKIGDDKARVAYLDQVCAENAALKERVAGLLRVHEREDEFLKSNPDLAKTAEHQDAAEMAGTRIGPYKLLQKIGEGGFGVVYMAEQEEPVHRRVALKIIKPGMDSRQVIARFEAERQALAMMDHPNIAKVLDAGTIGEVRNDGGMRNAECGVRNEEEENSPASEIPYSALRIPHSGRPYFVMELVHGIPITKFCDDQRLSPRERLALFIPVCHAIQHAHQKGIIHRDIKPSNILVCLYDGVPVPKVIDFGVAKAIQQKLTKKTMFTQFGQVIGTLEYMSPEQAEMNQLDIDTRSDVYSLGTVLYELLTGTTPFEPKRLRTAAFDEMLRIIREEDPPRPSLRLSTTEKRASISAQRQTDPARLSRLVRGELDWIIMKALEKQRSRRYETPSSLAKDIERYLDGEPVTAAAPSAAYRLRKFVRRRRAALAVAATIAGLLVASTVFSSMQWLRTERARAGERAQRERAEDGERKANEERRKTQDQKAAAEAAWRDAEWREYVSNMQLAFSDWERGILPRLRQTLDRTASSPHRAFEWYHWQAQLHQHRRTIYPQVRFLSGVRRSSDQRDIIVHTSADLTYRLDAGTGSIRAVYGSGLMSSDGRWLADGPHTANGTTLINLTTGSRTVVHLPENQTKVALSPDGARLITLDTMDPSSFLLRVWDVATSTELDEIKPRLQARYITGARFSPDGQWLAWEARLENGSEVELHRVSGGEPSRSPESLGGRFLGFTPDSRHLARWDDATRQIHLHSTRDLSDTKQIPCERAPGQIAFSPDGSHVAITTRDAMLNQVVINELETGRWVSTYRLNRIGGIAFTHDSHELMVAAWDGAVKFFPIESGDYIHIGSRVWNVQFNDEDASRLLIMTDDGARLIDVDSRTVLKEYPNVGNAGIFPDGRRIATVPPYNYSDEQGSTKITIADEEGIEVDSFEYDDRVLTLLVAPDGQRIFVAAPGSTFSVLDAKTGEKILQHNVHDLQAFGFLPDGKRFVVVFEGENEFRFYDAATGLQTDSMRCEPHDARGRVQFSPDGKRLVTPYIDEGAIYGVSIYDMATKERTQRIEGHGGIVYAAYFSPDGRRLFTKSDDGTLRLWDVETGFELLSLPDGGRKGEEPKVSGRALARDGRLIAIAGPEGVFLKEAATPEQVAAWQQPQEQPADTQWWRRLGGVQDWLVLAPIHLGEGEDFAEHLDKQQLSDEAHLDPRVGEPAAVNGNKLVWQRASTSDCILDFQNVTNPDEDPCLAYAVTHVYSDMPRKRLRMLVGGNDLVKVYLNGKLVYEFRKGRPAIPGDDEVLIDLERDKNVLVCKAIGEWAPGRVSAQIVGDDYQPIPGVTTGLAP